MPRKKPLILYGIRAIARHVLGDASKKNCRCVLNWHAAGNIPSFKIGHHVAVRLDELEAHFEAQKQAARQRAEERKRPRGPNRPGPLKVVGGRQ